MDPMTASLSQLSSWMTGMVSGPSGKSQAASLTTFRPIDLVPAKDPDHCERFINFEDFRSESFLSASSSETSASEEDSDVSTSSTSVSPPLFPVVPTWNRQSYLSCFSYPQPTYIRGDFSSVRPPAVSVPQPKTALAHVKREAVTPKPADRKLNPFSIDSILGDSGTSTGSSSTGEPAIVTSAFSQSCVSSLYPGRDSSHGDSSVYWCHVCHDFLSGSVDAMGHQMAHRSEGASCDLRRLIFREHGYVTRHEDTGYLNRIKCGLCDKILSGCFFNKHMRIHDGHVCHVCDHEFSTNSRLQDHMNIHNGLKPFTCTICDRKFPKKSSLNQHVRYHREYKSFQCSFCKKYFNSKYACSVHERLHTGNNPFKCQVTGCSKAFPQKIQLQLHMNSHAKRGDL